jgi:PII-like signaling protein
MEDAAEADFLGFAGDREIHFADAEELEREHPVAKVVKEKGKVVVVLERLNLHARDRFHIVLRLLIVETGDLVLHEAR